METLRNSTAPGESSTLHPVWADVMQAASASGGTSSEATLRLIWDNCLSRFPVQLQIQAMSLAAPCAPPSTLAAWMSHRGKSSSVDEPPALAMGLAMSLSRGKGGAEAAAALEARARSGSLTPEAALTILESLTDASPNFDSVTGTRLSAALIEVGGGGRGGAGMCGCSRRGWGGPSRCQSHTTGQLLLLMLLLVLVVVDAMLSIFLFVLVVNAAVHVSDRLGRHFTVL